MSEATLAEEAEFYFQALTAYAKSDHLWVEDGERIVCTHCGCTLKEGVGDECPDAA